MVFSQSFKIYFTLIDGIDSMSKLMRNTLIWFQLKRTFIDQLNYIIVKSAPLIHLASYMPVHVEDFGTTEMCVLDDPIRSDVYDYS